MKKCILIFMSVAFLASFVCPAFADYTNSGSLRASASTGGKVTVALSPKPANHDKTELEVHTVEWKDGKAVPKEKKGSATLTNTNTSETIDGLPKDTDLLITGKSYDKNGNVLKTYSRVIRTKKS